MDGADFRDLVRFLAPSHLDARERRYFLRMAFPDTPDLWVTTDTAPPRPYVEELLRTLRDSPHLKDGQDPLVVYLVTVQQELDGDRAEALGRWIEPLRTTRRSRGELRDDAIAEYLAALRRGWFRQIRERYVPLGAASDALGSEHVADVATRLLTVKRAVLLGEPGSGKTWTLGLVAAQMAAAWANAGGGATGCAPAAPLRTLAALHGHRGRGRGGAPAAFPRLRASALGDTCSVRE